MLDLFVFTFHDDGRIYRALSLLPPEVVEQHGLPTEAVLGEISALLPTMTPDQFEANEAFLAFLHEIVKKHAPELPELQARAQLQGSGYLYVVDERAGDGDEAAPEDVIGRFELSRGEIKAASYRPNEAYKLLTNAGPMQLPRPLEAALRAAVQDLIDANGT